MKVVNVHIEDRDFSRKESTGRTWREIILMGLCAAEKAPKEPEAEQ